MSEKLDANRWRTAYFKLRGAAIALYRAKDLGGTNRLGRPIDWVILNKDMSDFEDALDARLIPEEDP